MNSARKALLLGALLGLAPLMALAAGSPKTLAQADPELRRMLEEWRDMQVPTIARNADGTVPGFIADPMPVEGTINDLVAMLEREGQHQEGATESDREYYLQKGDALRTQWWVLQHGRVSAVVRSRLVSDGAISAVATAVLCEPRQPGACEELLAVLRKAGPQQPRSVPPRPPAYLLKLLETAKE